MESDRKLGQLDSSVVLKLTLISPQRENPFVVSYPFEDIHVDIFL